MNRLPTDLQIISPLRAVAVFLLIGDGIFFLVLVIPVSVYNKTMQITIKTLNKTMDIEALAFDLDGTLLGPGAILTERTLRAVRSCAEKGIQIILATGRAVEAAEKYRSALRAAGPHVYFNGAIVAGTQTETSGRKNINSILLAKEIAEFCLDLSRKRGVYFQIYMPSQDLLAEKEDPHRDLYYKNTGLLAGITDLGEVLQKPELQGCIKVMYVAEPEILDSIRPIIENRYGKEAYVVRSTMNYLEILDPRVSKGQGLLLALESRDLDPKKTIAFGDEENDLPMFEVAGLAIAPANAKENVKAGADLVIGSNAEDGLAVFLEEVFLSVTRV